MAKTGLYSAETQNNTLKKVYIAKPKANTSIDITRGLVLSGQMSSFKFSINPKTANNISWRDKDGKEVRLDNFINKVILLNFWASWCAPCIRELPSINNLQKLFTRNKFVAIALNIDRGGLPIASRYKNKLKLDQLELFYDNKNNVAKAMDIRALPTSILFDKKGMEVGRLVAAAEWDSQEAQELITHFIGKQ
ncbi:MAG: TlpA disulfide reductase family protein [Pseudomonadota bacterium]|nr:TlpA disulfide reductase family protein [Pseudomonadota bacterium]